MDLSLLGECRRWAEAALGRGLALAAELGDLQKEMPLLTSLDIFHHRGRE